MFAKRQSALAAAAGAPPSRRSLAEAARPVLGLLRRPPVAVAAAGLMLLAAGGLFVAVLGDPRAGLPSARAALNRTPAPVEKIDGADVFSLDAGLYHELGDEAVDGGALVTLPEGATVSGPGADISAPVRAAASPLAAAPMAGLSRPGPNGALPVIASDGRSPAQAYARPFRADGRPQAALIVGGLGLNAQTTRAAIERLPAEITLSFVPYAEGLQGWIDLARAHGHEVLIEIPMEPTGYPRTDPGPHTLLGQGGVEDVEARLSWLLGRAVGYFGVINYLGDRFAADAENSGAFMDEMRSRGLAFIDDGVFARRPGAWSRATADRVIDEDRGGAAILEQLNAIEASARQRGSALGTGFSYPVTIEAVARWSAGLDARGVQLAPASALTRRSGR